VDAKALALRLLRSLVAEADSAAGAAAERAAAPGAAA
jgi:hypothetical protein